MKRILKCQNCGAYTLQEKHSCGGTAINPQPAKWSPEDKYGYLRRQVKRKDWEEKGLV